MRLLLEVGLRAVVEELEVDGLDQLGGVVGVVAHGGDHRPGHRDVHVPMSEMLSSFQ